MERAANADGDKLVPSLTDEVTGAQPTQVPTRRTVETRPFYSCHCAGRGRGRGSRRPGYQAVQLLRGLPRQEAH